MARRFGSRLGSYEILAPLGAGGMGEVYRARDTRLNREVALKVLPDAVALDPGRLARLSREGQVLASLNHPNIAVIHGLEESGGACALVLELVEGPTLAERVGGGPVAIDEALKIAAQVAAALEAAHARGVTHRDLKPANIKVTPEGRVKLLDFGLATAIRFEGTPNLSTADTVAATSELGAILGTPAYMSPEQARGKPVDRRTDIWAFGCLLYELLTGQPAFRGETMFDVIAAVLDREPDYRALASAVPANVQDLVRRCLHKDLTRRLSDIGDARIEIDEILRAPATTRRTAAGPSFSSLAVLPFANASGDPEMEYLSDGLTASIILNLSQLPNLRVMARSTVIRYRGRDGEGQNVGRELGVDTVLTGSVLQRGDVLQISAELIDVTKGWQLWGARHRRTVSDIFATEEDIAKEITNALRLKLTPDNNDLLRRRYTDNVEAYHLYLKGRFYWEKRTAEALHKAIQLFYQAIEIDPTYALAYAGLAEAYIPLCFYGHVRPRDGFQKARAAAQKALEIDPGLAEALTVMGWVKSRYDWDRSASEETLRVAIAQNPKYARGRQALAEVLIATGRISEANAEIGLALQAEPLSLSINAAVGLMAYFARQYQTAIERFRQTIEMDSTFYPSHWYLAWAYEQNGQLSEAVSALREAQRLSHDNALVMGTLGCVYAAAGQSDEARAILTELEELSRRKYVSQLLIGVAEARLGHRDRALDCLVLASEDRCPWLGFALVDPKLDLLRGDRRFDEVARTIGLGPYMHGR